MSLKKFLYFLTEADGRSRQIVNGVVTSLTSPKPLPQAPDGNQEISIGWERSDTYYGNIRNFSLPLGFVMDGAKILRNDFYKFNIDRELYLLIKRLTYEWSDTTFKEYYKQLYKGQLDFATTQDDQGGYRFNIGIMEGGLHRLLKANESTQYELPFDIDAKNIKMDGMFIQGHFKWFLPDYPSLSDGYPTIGLQPSESPVPGLAIFDVLFRSDGFDPDENTLEYFAETTQDIADVNLSGLIENFNHLGAPGPLSVRIYAFNRNSNTLRLAINLTPDDPYPENYNLVVNETFDLVAGDRLFFKSGSHFSQGNLTLSVKSKPVNSTIRGFTLYDAGRKLIEKITGSADNFDSTLLQSLVSEIGHEIILTSGDGVRSISNASLKTSWRDFWKAVDVYTMAQMTITDKIRIEKRITAYQPESVTPAIELGSIKDLKITPAIDKMFTSVKIGHAEQQVDDTNGKFDFNGYMIFTSPVKSIPDKQLDLQSPYKASPYEIEQTRANYEGKTTTDKETDNDVFVLAVLPDDPDNSFDTFGSFFADGDPFAPGFPLISISAAIPQIVAGMKIRITGTALNNGDYTIASGAGWFFGQLIVTNEPLVNESDINFTIEILEGQYYSLDRSIPITQLTSPDVATEVKETVYNVPLSPKRILMRHSAWLAGCLYGYVPGQLVFSSANRNKEMIAGGITEKANVDIAALGDPMFIPKYLEFDTISPVDMTEELDNNPNPSFAPTWKDIRHAGFFIRGGIALNDLEEQTFKLLALPDSDFLSLIS